MAPSNFEDITGQTFWYWKVLKRGENSKAQKSRWWCECRCGETKLVSGASLKRGISKSCGCYRVETNQTHGNAKGKSQTSEYKAWAGIKTRCYNPNAQKYKDYGGRGIKVCLRWLDKFENFLADMGRKPGEQYSIDRINNNKHYTPSNCRWATKYEQIHNRRKYKRKKSGTKN